MTVGEYFDHVHRLVHAKGLIFESGYEMVERRDSGGAHGRLRGRLVFSERTFLQVIERVAIVDGAPVRVSYAYYCILDGEEVWAHENDPSHPMAIHQHDRDHDRAPDQERTLGEIIDKAWDTASDEDFWASPPPPERQRPAAR